MAGLGRSRDGTPSSGIRGGGGAGGRSATIKGQSQGGAMCHRWTAAARGGRVIGGAPRICVSTSMASERSKDQVTGWALEGPVLRKPVGGYMGLLT